jgi:hypothetical protein
MNKPTHPKFDSAGDFTRFLVVQRGDILRGPYGYLGPFATDDEVDLACERLALAEPAQSFYAAECMLISVAASEIEADYQQALRRLDGLAA